jgi:hypothetical protein
MTTLNIFFIIIFSLVIISFLVLIFYKSDSQKLDLTKERLSDSESECLDKYKAKYELITQMIEYTEKKYKVESSCFEDVRKLNIESLDSFKNEKLINKSYKEIMQIRSDNPKARESKDFKELIKKYNENEISIVSLRTYHNKYTLVFNNMIKKFPYNIISKLKKYGLNKLIEGRELDNNFNNLEV